MHAKWNSAAQNCNYCARCVCTTLWQSRWTSYATGDSHGVGHCLYILLCTNVDTWLTSCSQSCGWCTDIVCGAYGIYVSVNTVFARDVVTVCNSWWSASQSLALRICVVCCMFSYSHLRIWMCVTLCSLRTSVVGSANTVILPCNDFCIALVFPKELFLSWGVWIM